MSKSDFTFEYSHKSNFANELIANLTQKTVKESSYDPDSFEKPYNPDEIYRLKGDYTTYEKMMQDDQVESVIQLKKDLVLGSGFEIVGDEDVDEEIVEDTNNCLVYDQNVPFEDKLEEILSSYEFGFSLTEKIFKKKDDGKLTLSNLLTRHPNTWKIMQDEGGQVTDYIQVGNKGDMIIPSRNLIHYVNKRKFQNPFGTSDLKAAHTAWRVKVEIVKYYAIFLEKYAGGTAVGKYPTAMPKDARQDLYTALKRLQNSTAMTIPQGVEVEIMEAKSNGEAFERAINLFNTLIGRAVMIPDLLGYSGSETQGGSFALGENQMEIFFKHIRRRRKTLEKIINHHIIKPIVNFNHGMLDKYPEFKFKPIKDEDSKELAKLWIEAVKGKLYEPSDDEINHFREQINFPMGDVDRVQQPAPMFGTGPIGNGKADPEKPDPTGGNGRGSDEDDTEREDFKYKPTGSNASKRVDFKAIGKQLDGSESALLNDAKPIISDMLSRVADKVRKKKIVDDKQIDRLSSLKLERKADLKRVLLKHFKKIYQEAKSQASMELFQTNFAKADIENSFLEFLEEEIIFYIGDIESVWLKEIRVQAVEAIRDGAPFSAVQNFIDEELSRTAQISIERWARTRTTEVFNRGRVEFFNSSGVVVGYEYSAILDGRTTVVCAGLHGKRFTKGSEPIPPLHFNCRSLLIPITRFEEFEPDNSVGGTIQTNRGDTIRVPRNSIADHIKKNKGKGFSER